MKLFFAGDFCSRPSASLISVSEDLKRLIRSCTIRVVNFEVPLKPEGAEVPKGRERLWQNDDTPDFLRGIGFNCFSLANNHAFDWGEEGYLKTRSALGDDCFGAGTYEEAYRIKVVEVENVKIGFLGVTFAAYTGVFDDVMNHDGLGCAYVNDFRVSHAIHDAKKKVDYLFVLPHDGIEYIDIPLPETVARYRDFIDWGADGVIASHPHCPQGWEVYEGKPIFYSLGNFFFNSKSIPSYQADLPHWYEGLCVVIELQDGAVSFEVYNTKNAGNVSISLDDDPARDGHNAFLRHLLEDREEYLGQLRRYCASQGRKEMGIIDRTIHPHTLKASTRQVLKLWIQKLNGSAKTNDYPLKRLLTHDARRSLLLWTIRLKK